MDIETLKICLKEKRIVDALQHIEPMIEDIKEHRSILYVKKQLSLLDGVEPFYHFIRLMDYVLMYRHSAFLARYAHRRFHTLQTLTWVCDELLDARKPLDVEDLLRQRLAEVNETAENREHIARAYFTLVRAMLEMRRLEEAYQYMKQVEQYETVPMYDKWGYYYMQVGDREKAEEILRQGLDEPERGDMCHLLLADLYALNGHHEQALQIIEKGIAAFPQLPAFYVEKVRRLRDMNEYELALATMAQLDKMVPYHVHRRYFAHLRAQFYYKLNDLETLTSLLETEKSLASSPYHHVRKQPEGKQVVLPITPVVQKHNYCVPASLEMMLKLLGRALTQDEIAAHIFDVRGSKLSTTVHYLEELGFVCRFFIGSQERWKQLIDEGIPILLSVDYEHSSHVQVLFGYDERLQVFYVQDPNMFEPFFVSYEDIAKWYAGTHYLSLVAVPPEKKAVLNALPKEEDRYFRRIHEFAEKMDEDEKTYMEPFVAFLREHEHIPYTWLYVVKHFSLEETKEFLSQCAERLLVDYPDLDDLKLQVARAYIQLKEIERAETWLAQVKTKINSPMYHYLRGRLAFSESRYEDASNHFRASLQLDPDQPDVWSYMALSYVYRGKEKRAYDTSSIALSLQPDDRFIAVNHGMILFHAERIEEARHFFHELLRTHKQDAHIWYERARCDEKLGNIRKAERGFLVAKALEKHVPYPYLALADLYEFALDDSEKAEAILFEGVQKAEQVFILYVRLGDFYTEREQFEKAEHMYKQALEINENDPFAHLGIACLSMKKGDYEQGKQYLLNEKMRFKQHSEFLLNAGRMLLNDIQAVEEEHEYDVALTFLEEGLQLAQFDVAEVLEFYVQQVTEHSFIERGIAFLQHLVEQRPNDINFLCYLGVLYENIGMFSKAIRLYEQASHLGSSTFPLYRLAETYRALENMEQAKRYYEVCLQIDEAFAIVHLRLAIIYVMEDNVEKQRFHMLKALHYHPMQVNAEYVAELSHAPHDHEKLVQTLEALRDEVSDVGRLDSLAYAYGAIGDIAKEKALIEQALEIDPNHSELLHHYAKVFIKEEKAKQALDIIERLIDRDVHDESLYETYIKALAASKKLLLLSDRLRKRKVEKQEKSLMYMYAASALYTYITNEQEEEVDETNFIKRIWKRATTRTKQLLSLGMVIDLYETAIRLDRGNMEAYQRLAHFYEAGELIDDAVKMLRNALIYEWHFDVAYQLAMILISLNSEKAMKEAEELIEALLNEQPYHLQLLETKAFLLLDLQKEREAEQLFIQLIETEPFLSRSFYGLGKLYNEQQRYVEAMDVLMKGLDYHPKENDLVNELARAYHGLGQTEKALALIEEILAADEEHLPARYNRACYLALLGRTNEAQEELERVFAEDDSGYFYELAQQDDDLARLQK